jgi:hypothetical protein
MARHRITLKGITSLFPLRGLAVANESVSDVFGWLKPPRPLRTLATESSPHMLAVLDHLRRTIGEYNFAGQYQQQPAPLGGGMVKAEWFKTYVPGEQPSKFDMVFQSWDTANKSTELSDFSVFTTWGRKNKKFYLLQVLRQRSLPRQD